MHSWCLISLVLFVYVPTIYGGCTNSQKPRVCVIGAGIAGLNSAKYLAEYPDEFEFVVFEKNSDVGGNWDYTDSTTVDEHGLPVHSSIYRNLRVNSPTNLVFFPDFPEFKGENRSYSTHWDVHQYLRNFTDHFNLWQFIELNTNVEKVSPLTETKWLITVQNLDTKIRRDETCDFVVVGNGQDSSPYIPEIPGIQNFTGQVLHSHVYRRPEDFTGKTVVILGASFSGVEISIDLSAFAPTIYLSHRGDNVTTKIPENVQQVVGVVAADGDELILSDNSRIKADVLLFCTGYIYDFPFLDESSGITVEGGKYVRYIYKHVINIERPTMAFLNIPTPGIRSILPRAQIQFFIAAIRGKIKLPTKEEMLKDAEIPAGTSKDKAHYMLEETFPYYNNLSEIASFQPLPPYTGPGLLQTFADYLVDAINYKEKNVIIHSDGTFEFVNLTSLAGTSV